MNRRLSFWIMLVLCLSLGIGACIIVCSSTNEQPMLSLIDNQSVATISVPSEAKNVTPEVIEQPVIEETPVPEEKPEVSEPEPVVPEPEEEIEEPIPETPKYNFTVESIARRLCVRKEPSLNGEILGFVYSNQSGEVIELGEEWVQIKYDNLEGYAFREYLIIEELAQP